MMQTDCGRNEKKWGHSSRRLNLRGVSPFFLTYLYKSPYKLIISIITLWAFLFNIFGYELAWAHNSSGTVLPTVSTGAQNRPGHFILPTSLGEIKEIYHHPSFDSAANGGLAQDELPFSKKMVIHIQDAHCNYSAQKSINEIVKYLNKNYGIELVGLEGGEGNYDLSVFTRIKDLNLRKKVADYFLKEGRINGAEYYAILNPDKVTLKGVENSKLYIKNLNIYKEHLKDKPKIDQALNTLSKHITKQKQKIYSKKLLELDQKSNQYHNNEIDLKEYLNYLTIGDSAQKKWGHKNGDSLLCGATKQTVPIFSNLSSLIEIIEEEGNINFKRCKSERQDLIRDIKPIISKLELENLLKYSLNFKNGLMKEDQFYLYLLEKAESCDIDINKYYPNLVRFSKFLRKYESLDKYKVFEELKNFEETLFKKLAENDKQIKLYNTSKDLDIVEKFFNVRLTRPEYDYYRENDPILSLRGKNGDTLLLEQGVPIFSEAISKILTKHQKTFEKFYSYSLKRDNAFIKNLESIGQTHGSAPTTVLITGGFHTENLKELFKKHGYSYIVILPKFDPNEETPYFRLLSGGLSPVEEAIRAKTSGLAMYSTLNHIWEMINRKDADNFHLAVNEVALQGGLYSAPTGEIDSIRASPSEEKSEKKETQALSDNETKSLPKTPLWRRMLQFRLRTLFILTTIIALVIGTFIYRYGRKVEFFMGGKAREHVEKEVLDSPNLKVLREARKQSEYREKDFEYLKQEEWQFQEELDVEIFPKLAKVDLLNNKTWDIKEADIESINWRVQAGWMVLQEGIVEIKLKDGREILYATRDNQKEPIKLIKAPNEGKVDMFKRCLSETESILQNVKKENIDWYPDEYGEAIRIVRTYGCYASGGLATDELINVLNDKSKIPEFRADSARLLSYLGLSAKPAIPDLIKALKNDENSSVRFQASDALASLLYHLKRDLDPETKNEMTEALKTAIKNDSELLREIEENHPNMTNIGSFIDDIKDEEEDQKSAPSRKISPSEPTRSSPLKVKLNEGNKMRDRAVAEIPEDEMIDVKTGGVIKGEIATSTIYSYAEPCILVLIFDRSINKTYYVHSRLLELDNVFEIINAAFDNIGNGPNVDVVFGGGSLNSKVGLRYNQMVWKRRQKVAEYLKKKGYSTDKCFYPKYSNMAADFYFDRKTTNVIIDFVNTGEEIRNEELMKRLQEVNDAKSTVITKPPSEPARSSASTLQAGIHTLAGEVLEVAIVESPVSKIAESIIGRTIDFVRRKKLTSKDLSDIVWALRENELPRTENGSLRLISDDEIMYILEQLNDRLIDIDFPLGSVISSYLKPPDPLVHLRPQIVDKEPRIWLSLSSLNRLIENLPTFFKTADIEKDEFPVLLARDAITAGEFLCYIGFITGQTIDSASVYQPGLHNHAILSDYVSDRGIEIVQEITEKAKAKAIQKLQFHEEKIPAKKGDPFYDNFHPAIFEEMAKSFKEFMVREWENSPELLKEAKALYEQCKRNGITQRKNLVLLDLAATGKTLLYVKAVLEYFSEKEGLDLRNIRVFVGYSHDRKLCLPEIRLFDKQFNTEGRPFKDQMWPFYRVANGSHNGEVLFKFHKDRTKVLIHVYRSLMLYNTALSASRASAAQAQGLEGKQGTVLEPIPDLSPPSNLTAPLGKTSPPEPTHSSPVTPAEKAAMAIRSMQHGEGTAVIEALHNANMSAGEIKYSGANKILGIISRLRELHDEVKLIKREDLLKIEQNTIDKWLVILDQIKEQVQDLLKGFARYADDDDKAYMEVKSNLEEAVSILENRIAFARNELSAEPINITKLVQKICDSKGIEFKPGKRSKEIYADADARSIYNALTNVVENAIYAAKAIDDENPEQHVSVELSREKSQILFRIKNRGKKIPPYLLEKNAETRTVVVEDSGGTIDVTSEDNPEDGWNTKFEIRLPEHQTDEKYIEELVDRFKSGGEMYWSRMPDADFGAVVYGFLKELAGAVNVVDVNDLNFSHLIKSYISTDDGGARALDCMIISMFDRYPIDFYSQALEIIYEITGVRFWAYEDWDEVAYALERAGENVHISEWNGSDSEERVKNYASDKKNRLIPRQEAVLSKLIKNGKGNRAAHTALVTSGYNFLEKYSTYNLPMATEKYGYNFMMVDGETPAEFKHELHERMDKAAIYFDPSKKVNGRGLFVNLLFYLFNPLIEYYIKREVARLNMTNSLSDPVYNLGMKTGKEITIANIIPSRREMDSKKRELHRKRLIAKICRAIGIEEARNVNWVIHVLVDGESAISVAEKAGVTRQAVSYHVEKVRMALFEFKDEFKSALEGDLSIWKMKELVKSSRSSAAQAQELGAEEELAEKTGIIKQDGLPYVKIRVTKKVKLNSINIGIAKIAISIDIPGSSELALSIERPLSESIEDTWDLITEFMHDSNVKIARDISDEDLDYLREQFSQALDSIEDSYIFERDLRGVNYEQVAYFTEEFYNFIKNRVFNLCDPTREQGQIIEKELKEIIEESLKNAFESIQIRFIHESVTGHKDVPMAKRPPQIGEIKVALIPKKDSLIFQIVDDGKGLTEAIAKFTEVAHDDREAIPEWLGESLKRREAEGVQSLTKYSHPEVFSDKSGQGNGLLMIEHFSHERLIHGKWTLEDRMKKLGDKTGAVFTYCFNMHDSVEKKDAKTSEIRSSSASDEWEPEDFFDKLDELYVTRSWATAKRLLIKILLHYKELPNLFLGEEESVDSYFRRIASIIKARGWESNIVRIKHEFYKRGNEKAEGYASEFDRKYLSKRSRPATSPVEEDDLTDEFKIRGRSRIEFKIQPGDRMKLDDEDERVVAGKNKEGEYLIIDPENPKIQKVEIFDIHELMLGKDSTYHRPSGSDPEIETIKDYFVDESRRGTANLKYPMEDGYTAIVSLRTGEKERVNVHRFRLVEIISGPHGVDPSSLQRLILGIEKANAECEARAQSSRSTAEYIAESNFFDNEMRFMATMELAMRGYYRKAFATICSPERPHMSSDGLKYFFKKREQNEMAKDSDAVGHRVAVDKDHYHNARENMITWLKTDEKYEDILKRHFGEDEESEESPEGTLKRNPNRVKSAFKKSIKEEFDSAARSLIKSLKTTLGKLDSNWETESIEPKAEELLRRKTRYASKKELIAEFLFIIRELEAVIARPVVGKGNYLVFSKADDNRVREVCETIDAIASSAKSTTTDKPAVRIEIRIDEKSVVPPSFGADIVNDLDMIKPVLQECANYGNSLVKVLNNSIRRDLPGFLTTSPISANPEPQAGSETPPNDARASAIEKAQEFLSDGISTVMSEIDKLKGQIGPGGAGEGNADIVKAVERVECELRVAATHLATGDVVRTYNDLFYAWKDFIRLRKDLRRIDGGLLALSELEKVLREPRKLFFSIDPNLLIRTQLKMVYIHIRMEKRALTRFPRIRKSLSSMHSRLNDAISQVDYPDHPTRDFFNAGLLVHGKRLTDIIKRIEKIRHRQQAKSVIADLSNAQTELFNAHQQLMDLVDVIKENESRSSPSSASDRDPPNNTRTLAADGKPQAFRASSTRIMLTDDESVKVRSIAELRKGRIVEVKDDHPLIGDTGTYTLYAKAKPCILVLFYNRLTGRTSMIHNYDLRVVLDNIDRIEEDMGAGNNIDVICAGRSLDRSQDWDYNNDVFTMRSQVMGYLGKKGYENVKHYFPKKSNTTTHFYFDRKNKVVTIKTRKKGDQELNASLLERLRKARASAATSDDPEDPTQQLIEEISGMFDAIDAKSKKWRKKYRETEVKVRLVVASRKRLKHSLESCKQWEKLEAEYYKSLDRIQPAACVFVEWFELYKQVLHEFKNEFRRLRRLYPNRIDINRLRQIRDEMRILAHGFHRRTDSLHKAIEELYHVSSRREAFLAELGEGGPRLSPISSAVQGRHMGLPLQRVESWKDPDTLEKLIKKRIKTVRHLKRPNGVVYTVLVTGDIGPLETRGTTEALSHSYKDIFGAEIKSKLIFCSDTAEASAELSKRTDATPSNTIIYVAADVEYDGSLKEFIRTSVATSEGRSMFVVPAIEYKADAQLYTEFIRRVGILLRSMLKKSKNHSAGKLSKEIRKDSLLTSLARAMADIRSDITERYVSEEEMLDLVPGIIDMLEGNITIKQYVEKYSQQHTFNLPPGEKTDWETDMKDFLDMQRKLHEA